MYVLDSCAFINEFQPSGPTATVPSVREELQDASQYRFDAMQGSGMRIQIPAEETRERVRRAAKDSGDLEVLSQTDLYLIAAAVELGGKLVTDDYAMQNVSEKLDVEVEFIAQDGIEEERDWKFQCQGCGRVYDEEGRCRVCGSETERKNPSA